MGKQTLPPGVLSPSWPCVPVAACVCLAAAWSVVHAGVSVAADAEDLSRVPEDVRRAMRRVVTSASRRFTVLGDNPRDNLDVAAWAESVAGRIETALGVALPRSDRHTARIVLERSCRTQHAAWAA